MPGYYSERLAAERLRAFYDLAPPRTKAYLEAEIEFVLSRTTPAMVALELGCGYGRVLERLLPRAHVTWGIDTSLPSFHVALEFLGRKPSLRLACMDAIHMGFRDHIFAALFKEVRDDITSEIPELHDRLEILVAPLKSVACRLGLVAHGCNNLTYIPDWGSYFQLVGYVTDEDIGIADDWRPKPLRLMPECENCGICFSVCPTGAINDGRILSHAELCTTLFSEQPGDLNHDLSFDCLFGCLECQQICPANSGLLRIESAGVTFDRRETEAILSGYCARACDNTESVPRKLAVLGLTEEVLIGRNLAHLIAGRVQAQ